MESWFFEKLNGEDLAAVVRAAKVRKFPAGSVVLNQEDPAENMFLLTVGHARHFYITDSGEKILLRWLTPGDITGCATLLPKVSRYLMGTEVVEKSEFLVWDRATMNNLTIRYPRLLQNSLLVAEIYFDWYLTDHIALTCHSGPQRCASVLKRIGRQIGKAVPGGIELSITNEELASTAGVTLFEVSRVMSYWKHSGLIEKTRGKVVLKLRFLNEDHLQGASAVVLG